MGLVGCFREWTNNPEQLSKHITSIVATSANDLICLAQPALKRCQSVRLKHSASSIIVNFATTDWLHTFRLLARAIPAASAIQTCRRRPLRRTHEQSEQYSKPRLWPAAAAPIRTSSRWSRAAECSVDVDDVNVANELAAVANVADEYESSSTAEPNDDAADAAADGGHDVNDAESDALTVATRCWARLNQQRPTE